MGIEGPRCIEDVYHPHSVTSFRCSRMAVADWVDGANTHCTQHSDAAKQKRAASTAERYRRVRAKANAPRERLARLEAQIRALGHEPCE